MQSSYILSGGLVIDPANGVETQRDVAIHAGTIVPADSVAGADVIDVNGLAITPGLIDLHVHLRDPGQTHKEDLVTGTRAAAAGGFTCVVAMPNTSPPVDCPAVLEDILSRAGTGGVVRVLQTATLSVGRAGAQLTDAGGLKAAGAIALTDDGSCLQSAGLMLSALEAARDAGLPVIEHCEDESVSRRGVMNAGATAASLGVAGQPHISEDLIVARDIVLAQATGWGVHMQHISTAGAVDLVRWAQSCGIPVTAEAAPHHLCLTELACADFGADAKMNPPLRRAADRDAVVRGLQDGTICALATDHAPHSADEKAGGLRGGPFGIIGLEAALPICLTELHHSGVLGLSDFIAKFTVGPRAVLKLPYGTLSPGCPADVTILDLDREHVLDVSSFHSRSRNCPYDGRRCRGKVVGTIVEGKPVFSELPQLVSEGIA
ncbi:MAG: dihydroorotase [Lentisphaerae bacterium]|jgi:dihydroorotase|nr:dihydroorotase [Lentisphaerota bacterium]MBT4819295.1 dihydroorotase [Lentisphaerota bacterium]MBT5610547.1 dihydroorotase [Lentisphaerota bacterium]MBT7054419.1 dihydroorotase [Lentisphaerota bacterium]MBT7842588.1 dihydroorotase [Lentisphaerota bacterium]